MEKLIHLKMFNNLRLAIGALSAKERNDLFRSLDEDSAQEAMFAYSKSNPDSEFTRKVYDSYRRKVLSHCKDTLNFSGIIAQMSTTLSDLRQKQDPTIEDLKRAKILYHRLIMGNIDNIAAHGVAASQLESKKAAMFALTEMGLIIVSTPAFTCQQGKAMEVLTDDPLSVGIASILAPLGPEQRAWVVADRESALKELLARCKAAAILPSLENALAPVVDLSSVPYFHETITVSAKGKEVIRPQDISGPLHSSFQQPVNSVAFDQATSATASADVSYTPGTGMPSIFDAASQNGQSSGSNTMDTPMESPDSSAYGTGYDNMAVDMPDWESVEAYIDHITSSQGLDTAPSAVACEQLAAATQQPSSSVTAAAEAIKPPAPSSHEEVTLAQLYARGGMESMTLMPMFHPLFNDIHAELFEKHVNKPLDEQGALAPGAANMIQSVCWKILDLVVKSQKMLNSPATIPYAAGRDALHTLNWIVGLTLQGSSPIVQEMRRLLDGSQLVAVFTTIASGMTEEDRRRVLREQQDAYDANSSFEHELQRSISNVLTWGLMIKGFDRLHECLDILRH